MINELIVIIVSNKNVGNSIFPQTEVFKYDIFDDGKDIIKYIENRKLTGYVPGGKLVYDQDYEIKREEIPRLSVGDRVAVVKFEHPLDGWRGEIKEVRSDVCLVLIDDYFFNIDVEYLRKR